MDAYELTLFSNNKRHLEDRGASGTTAHGTRRESVLEMVLKMLAGYVRIKSMNKDLVASAQLHLNLLEEMKKEFTVREASVHTHSKRGICTHTHSKRGICTHTHTVREASVHTHTVREASVHTHTHSKRGIFTYTQ